MSARRFEPRVCSVCGRRFAPTSSNQVYCTRYCQRANLAKVRRARDEAHLAEARKAVAALDEDARLTLKALLASDAQWVRMRREVLEWARGLFS